MKPKFLCLALLWVGAWQTVKGAVPVRIYKFHAKNMALGYENEAGMYAQGIRLFETILEDECEISNPLRLRPTRTIARGARALSLSRRQSFHHDDPRWLRTFPFRQNTFQYTGFKLIQSYRELRRADNEISIVMVESLSGGCGEALPRVQFPKKLRRKHRRRILSQLVNRIFIHAARSQGHDDCRYPARILAHELAHLFIQDSPAHTCLNADGRRGECPEDNLLRVSVRQAPRFRAIMNMNRGGVWSAQNPQMTLWEDGLGGRTRPASGLKLTANQCRSIRLTLNQLSRGGWRWLRGN